ncbi:MAG: nucleotidyltransferase domain-containing protein [bacterium]|jgi:predicted nucleotidyltransferase
MAVELEAVLDRVVSAADPDRVILFGSRAYGKEKADSDFDLLVIKAGIKHRRALAQKVYRNLAGIPASVDILVETPEGLEKKKSIPGLVYADAAKGQVVYER